MSRQNAGLLIRVRRLDSIVCSINAKGYRAYRDGDIDARYPIFELKILPFSKRCWLEYKIFDENMGWAITKNKVCKKFRYAEDASTTSYAAIGAFEEWLMTFWTHVYIPMEDDYHA